MTNQDRQQSLFEGINSSWGANKALLLAFVREQGPIRQTDLYKGIEDREGIRCATTMYNFVPDLIGEGFLEQRHDDGKRSPWLWDPDYSDGPYEGRESPTHSPPTDSEGNPLTWDEVPSIREQLAED